MIGPPGIGDVDTCRAVGWLVSLYKPASLCRTLISYPRARSRCLAMNYFRPTLVFIIATTAAVGLAGCGRSYGGRQEIKGTIKFKGELLDGGTIEFFPTSGDAATKSGAQIVNGIYSIKPEFGLLPGKYRVSITAGDGRTRSDAPLDAPPGPTGGNIVSRERIPKEYNIESKQDVEVTEGGPNVFDFDIP